MVLLEEQKPYDVDSVSTSPNAVHQKLKISWVNDMVGGAGAASATATIFSSFVSKLLLFGELFSTFVMDIAVAE